MSKVPARVTSTPPQQSFVVGTIIKPGHNYLLKGSEKEDRNQEETPSSLLPALCTGEQSTALDTYPAISKNGMALFHQDIFDEDGVQNGQHRLPAVKNPKPREIHGQSIAHRQLEQKQPALSAARAVHIDCWSPKGLGQLSPLRQNSQREEAETVLLCSKTGEREIKCQTQTA